MGFIADALSPNIENVPRTSAATPLTETLVQLMNRELGRTGGQAFGGLREAGTGIRQFLASGGGNIELPTRDQLLRPDISMPESVDLSGLVGTLENVQNRRVGEQAADLRESFGAAGDRFGTALATGEGRFRRDAEADFEASIGQLLEGARRFDVGARTQAELGRGQLALGGAQLDVQAQQEMINNLLRALGLQTGIASQTLSPFTTIAQAGAIPSDVSVSDSPWMQLLELGSGIAAAAAGGG